MENPKPKKNTKLSFHMSNANPFASSNRSTRLRPKYLDEVLETETIAVVRLKCRETTTAEKLLRSNFQSLKHVKVSTSLSIPEAPVFSSLIPSSLETLDLSEIRIDSLKSVCLILNALPRLKVLCLTSLQLGDDGIREISPSLKHLSLLETLDLSKNSISRPGVEDLISSLKTLSKLEGLNLSSNELMLDSVEILIPVLEEFPCFKHLNLRSNYIRHTDWGEVQLPFQNLVSLETLELSTSFGTGREKIARALRQLKHLHTLNLQGFVHDPEDTKDFPSALETLSSSLRSLSLQWNARVDPEAGLGIVTALGKLAELTSLRLTFENNADAFAALAPSLSKLTALESLDLSYTVTTGPNSAPALASILENLTKLRRLELSSCGLGPLDLETLARVFTNQNFPRLEVLNLSNNDIQASGATSLKTILESLGPSVLELNISHNNLTFGLYSLASALEKLVNLQRLNLGANVMDQKDAKAIGPAISNISFLKLLNLSSMGIDSRTAEYLIPAIIGTLPNLEELSLANNPLLYDDVLKLFSVTKPAKALKYLNLDDVSLGSDEAASLLKNFPMLEELRLKGNRIGRTSVNNLASSLASLRYLTSLELRANRLGIDGAVLILKAVKSCDFLSEIDLTQNGLAELNGIEAIAPLVGTLGTLKTLGFESFSHPKHAAFYVLYPRLHELGFGLSEFARHQKTFKLVILLCSIRNYARDAMIAILPIEMIKCISRTLFGLGSSSNSVGKPL